MQCTSLKATLAAALLVGLTRCGTGLNVVPEYHAITPTSVTPLSETSALVTWTSAADSQGYDIFANQDVDSSPNDSTHLVASVTDPNAASATVTGLAPGSLGQIIVRSLGYGVDTVAQPGIPYWTPYAALWQPNVNSTDPVFQGFQAGGIYAEALYVSPTFSFFSGHGYVPEISYVYTNVPETGDMPDFSLFTLMNSQTGFNSTTPTDYSQAWGDGTKFAVSQIYNAHRVLLYDNQPTSQENIRPTTIIGQDDYMGGTANAGVGSVNSRGLNYPTGICYNGTTFYVADSNNHRILGFNGWPTTTGQVADFVLGQPNFTSNTPNNGGVAGNPTATSLYVPYGLACFDGKLAAVDNGNHRVLIWNTAPTANGAVPDVILGQAASTTRVANNAGGIGVGGMNAPYYIAVISRGATRTLLVTDYGNNRVLQWNSIPTANATAYDTVYGQPDRVTATANTGGRTHSTFNGPWGIVEEVGADRFWVSDFSNARFTIYDIGNTTARGVWGLPDSATTAEQASGMWDWYGSYTSLRHGPNSLRSGWNGYEGNGVTFRIDPASGAATANNRMWTTAPSSASVPDKWRDAPSLDSSPPGYASKSATSGSLTSALKIGSRWFWIADSSRILSRSGDFSTGLEAADLVLGRQDLTGANVTAATFDYAISPSTLAAVGTTLLAVDGPRIVGWTNPSAGSNQAVSFALGQPDILTRAANSGGVAAGRLGASVPSLTVSGAKLIVADRDNHRVLIWNSIASQLSNGSPADVVLGQSLMTTSASGSGLGNMTRPAGVTVVGSKLLVADRGNQRILVWDTIPTVSGTPADRSVDPHTAFRFSLPTWFNSEALSPTFLDSYGGRVYLSLIDRVLIVPDFF